jgi:hypothetical protein
MHNVSWEIASQIGVKVLVRVGNLPVLTTLSAFGSFTHGLILKNKTVAETSPKCSKFSSKL